MEPEPVNIQRQFFEKLAPRYDRRLFRSRWPRNQVVKAHLIARHLGPVALRTRIAELGCGTCQIAELLLEANLGLRYVGLDLSPSMLEIGRRRLQRFSERVELRIVSGPTLPLGHGSFSGAFGVDVLHHVTDRENVLRLLREALIPGSPIVFLEGNPLFPLNTLIGLAQREERGLFSMTSANLRRWLDLAGFHDAEVKPGPLYTPPGPERLVPFLDGVDLLASKTPGLRRLAIFSTISGWA